LLNSSDIRARIIAAVAGVALLLSLAFATESQPPMSLWILFSIYIGSFTIAGILLGFIWPNSGWRLGACLFSIVPLFVLASILFSDPPPVIHWKEELLGLFGWVLILPGAMLGAWAGSLIRRSVSGDKSVAVKHPLSRA